YEFINREKHQFPEGFADELKKAITGLAELQLTRREKMYFAATCPYIDPTYFDFLQGYRYDPDEVTVEQHGGDLRVAIKGYWYRTILWEVPIMSLICELYYTKTHQKRDPD